MPVPKTVCWQPIVRQVTVVCRARRLPQCVLNLGQLWKPLGVGGWVDWEKWNLAIWNSAKRHCYIDHNLFVCCINCLFELILDCLINEIFLWGEYLFSLIKQIFVWEVIFIKNVCLFAKKQCADRYNMVRLGLEDYSQKIPTILPKTKTQRPRKEAQVRNSRYTRVLLYRAGCD